MQTFLGSNGTKCMGHMVEGQAVKAPPAAATAADVPMRTPSS